MTIETNFYNQIAVIKLAGRFDASVTDNFKATVEQLLKTDRYQFVVDLRQVNYIDSSGLGSMVAAVRKVREQDGDIILAEPSDKLRSLFALTRMARLFEIYDDQDVALNACSKSSLTS